MPRAASTRPATDLRGRTIEWKRQSLAQVQELISSLRAVDRELDKIYGVVKSNARSIHSGAQKLYKDHEKAMETDQAREEDDGSEEEDAGYDEDVMSALENVPNADEQVDDAKLQIGEHLEGLITFLEEGVKDMIKEVNP